MLEIYRLRDVENADTPEISDTIVPKRERMVNALRRRQESSIISISDVEEFTKSIRYFGFERITIPLAKH